MTLVALLVGCGTPHWREDPNDWFDPGTQVSVEEPVEFTDVPYDFPLDDDDGIGALGGAVFPVDYWTVAYAEDDQYPAESDCESSVHTGLPFEVEGIVTILPDFYFKTDGCTYDDEKFYGSYFIEDRTGGLFILGDSKVAHFDMGDKVRMVVRGARTSWDMDMVVAHDVIEVVERDLPIAYELHTESLSLDDISRVKRMIGIVQTDPDTFGEVTLLTDDGVEFHMSLDSELNRRDVSWPIGTRLSVTGPVIFSYDIFSLVIMRVGQVEVLDSE